MNVYLLKCLAGLAVAYSTVGVLHADHPMETTAERVVERLRDHGAPICFERVRNKMADAVRLGEEVASLEAASPEMRSAGMTDRLAGLKALLKEGTKGDAVIDWRQKRFNFTFPEKENVREVLAALIAADPDYAWQEVGARYVVYPKSSSLNDKRVSFRASDLSGSEMRQAMVSQIAGPAGLNYMEVSLGMRPSWWQTKDGARYSLELPLAGARDALTKVAEVFGDDVVWDIRGIEGVGDNLFFGRLRGKSAAP